MKGKRNPWLQLPRLLFGEKRAGDDAEIERLVRQINRGYANTGLRDREAMRTRDRERALLVERFGAERLKSNLTKSFLYECIDALNGAKDCAPPEGGWSPNAVRLLIKQMRKPPVAPSPYGATPDELAQDPGIDDPSDYM